MGTIKESIRYFLSIIKKKPYTIKLNDDFVSFSTVRNNNGKEYLLAELI